MKTHNILYPIFCLLIGATFIVSGVTKMFPIEPFEFSFVETKIIDWTLAPFLARFFIGIELFIGTLFILNLYLKEFTYRAAYLLLIFFSLYLIVKLSIGNEDNCGCFGEFIPMSPFQAIVKNAFMLILIFICNKSWVGWKFQYLKVRHNLLLIGFFSFTSPFILNTLQLDYSEAYLNRPEEVFKLNLDTLYENFEIKAPPKSLSKGKHVMAFFSLSCPHCKIAAKKIALMHKLDPDVDYFMVLNGKKSEIRGFLRKTNTQEIGYSLLLGDSFIYLSGIHLPVIYLLNDNMVEHVLHYKELNQHDIDIWWKQKNQ
jgi:hypothetical protein